MKITLPAHPSWTVQLDEVSPYAFRLIAIHPTGAKIDLAGFDPESMIKDADDTAGKIEADIQRKYGTIL